MVKLCPKSGTYTGTCRSYALTLSSVLEVDDIVGPLISAERTMIGEIDRILHNAQFVSHSLLHRLTKTVLVPLCQAQVTKRTDN